MKFFLFSLIFASIFLSSCQKDLSSESRMVTPINSFTDDTSKILTLVDYEYTSGIVTDSAIRVLRNATLNGQKEITLTETSPSTPGDTAFTVYKYDNQNRLIDIKLTYNFLPGVYDHDIITRTGDNITRLQYDSSGTITHTSDYSYVTSGADTKISVTNSPAGNDTIYTGPTFTDTYFYKTDLFVRSDFSPDYKSAYIHEYISNINSTNLPYNGWDTTKQVYTFSGGDLFTNIMYGTGSDTNSIGYPAFDRYKDTISFTYTRNMAGGLAFNQILRSLYGNNLFTLFNYYDAELSDYLLPESFNDLVYNDHGLNSYTQGQTYWHNGVPDPSSTSPPYIVVRYAHSFDSQQRLVQTLRYSDPSTNDITSGIKIIYP